MKPTSDRVLIRPVREPEPEDRLIVVPEAYRPQSETAGHVVAVGPKCVGDVKVGDAVYFSPFSGQGVVVDGEEFIMMREAEILAVEE